MELLLIIALPIILFAKTYKYNNIIDDICKRSDYLTVHTEDIDKKEIYFQQHGWVYTATNIIVYTVNAVLIYLIWGFWASIIWIVMPLNVSGGAWKIGNFYMTSLLFMLTGYYFILTFNTWEAYIFCAVLYWFALQSSVNAIPFVFFVVFQKLLSDML